MASFLTYFLVIAALLAATAIGLLLASILLHEEEAAGIELSDVEDPLQDSKNSEHPA
jgi:hypothetical protein